MNVCDHALDTDPTVLLGELVQGERERDAAQERKTRRRPNNFRGALSGSPLVSAARPELWVSSVHVSFSPLLVKCEEGVAAVITQTCWELTKKKNKKKQTVTDQCQKSQSFSQHNLSNPKWALCPLISYVPNAYLHKRSDIDLKWTQFRCNSS